MRLWQAPAGEKRFNDEKFRKPPSAPSASSAERAGGRGSLVPQPRPPPVVMRLSLPPCQHGCSGSPGSAFAYGRFRDQWADDDALAETWLARFSPPGRPRGVRGQFVRLRAGSTWPSSCFKSMAVVPVQDGIVAMNSISASAAGEDSSAARVPAAGWPRRLARTLRTRSPAQLAAVPQSAKSAMRGSRWSLVAGSSRIVADMGSGGPRTVSGARRRTPSRTPPPSFLPLGDDRQLDHQSCARGSRRAFAVSSIPLDRIGRHAARCVSSLSLYSVLVDSPAPVASRQSAWTLPVSCARVARVRGATSCSRRS